MTKFKVNGLPIMLGFNINIKIILINLIFSHYRRKKIIPNEGAFTGLTSCLQQQGHWGRMGERKTCRRKELCEHQQSPA
jgi:hypothetical protein